MPKKKNHLGWTKSPKTAIPHIAAMATQDKGPLIRLYSKMALGGDGGQIEPWSFNSVRSELYPKWSDADFLEVCNHFLEELSPTGLPPFHPAGDMMNEEDSDG